MALSVDNAEPTWSELNEAKLALPAIMERVADLIEHYPAVSHGYAREQPAFKHVTSALAFQGWVYCGSGYYSACYYKGGLVIKVGFKPEDSALAYSAWCRANQGRAGVPVIHKLMARGCGYTMLMDRLGAICGELEKGTASFNPQLHAEFDSVQETINLGVDGWGDHMELCRTAADIRDFFADIANFDVHPGNVMLDRNGALIITDPVSFVGDTLSGE
jgi:hypothetical protein